MLVEEALLKLGKPGKYHLIVYAILFLTNAYVAFHHVSLPSVYGITPPFRYFYNIYEHIASLQIQLNLKQLYLRYMYIQIYIQI